MKDGEVEESARGRWLLWLACGGLAWFLFRDLSLEWRINPQYSYGWVVPFLTLYLLIERWRDRPAPSAPIRSRWMFWVALAVLIPLRLTQEANPDWRLTNWLAAMICVTLVWFGFAVAGGRAWWKHFAFATAFVLTAVAWPTPLENALVRGLMRSVASVAVEFLNWFGIAAEQQGNLIQLAGGTLGIDEACSGVRSFQATIMITLCLGELHRLTASRRIFLVAVGTIYALALNLFRAALLAIIAARTSLANAERWHDPAGYLLLGLVFFGVWFAAKCLAKPSIQTADHAASLRWPLREAALVVCFLMAAEIMTLSWYRSHERDEHRRAQWTVDWPNNPPAFMLTRISENIRLVLRFNHGDAAIWNRPDGSRWHLYFFSWKPGRAAAQLARSHRPETCLPATGFEFYKNRGTKRLTAAGLELPIERIDFQNAGQLWHVYYCLWEDRLAHPNAASPVFSRATRLQAVLEGRRHLGQRVLEVVIAGIDSPEQADAEFEKAAAQWIKVE